MDTRSSTSRALALAAVLAALVAAAVLAGGALAAPGGVPGPAAPDQNPPKSGQKDAGAAPGLTAEKQKKQDTLLPVARHLAQQARAAGSDIAGVDIDVDTGVVN